MFRPSAIGKLKRFTLANSESSVSLSLNSSASNGQADNSGATKSTELNTTVSVEEIAWWQRIGQIGQLPQTKSKFVLEEPVCREPADSSTKTSVNRLLVSQRSRRQVLFQASSQEGSIPVLSWTRSLHQDQEASFERHRQELQTRSTSPGGW